MNSLKIGIWNADGLCHHKLELVQFLIKEMLSDVGRGGAVIIIRSNLIHHPLSFTSQANAQAVAISLRNNSDLTIAAIYLKPGGRQDTIDDAQLLDIFLGLGPRNLASEAELSTTFHNPRTGTSLQLVPLHPSGGNSPTKIDYNHHTSWNVLS
ncbi:hypothetical protein ACLKA7_005006 [Drosophila subpalustris]